MNLGRWVCIKGMELSILMCTNCQKGLKVSWNAEGTRLPYFPICTDQFIVFTLWECEIIMNGIAYEHLDEM